MTPDKIALIYNPRSHTVRRNGSLLEATAPLLPDAHLLRIDDFAALPTRIREMAQSGVTRFCIEGGDGTVVAVLSAALHPETHLSASPEFAVLPGGSTNLTYDIVGLRATTPHDVATRLQNPNVDRLRQRALQIAMSDDPNPQIGFLFSTGSLARAMQYVQREFHSEGRRGVMAVASAIFRFVLTPRKYIDRDGQPLLRASDYDLSAADLTLSGTHCMSIATTLPRLSLGIHPFWGTGSGPIVLTHVAWPVYKLRRTIIAMFLGRTSRSFAERGFTSYRCDGYELTHTDALMLDGEVLPIPQNGRITVSTTDPLVFLR